MTLEQNLQKFSALRTDKNRKRWSDITKNQAPHKPFLLLSVIDLFAQGEITENFIDILTLSDRNIIKPEKMDFWPDQKNLEWHRGKVFCR
jgi:hypothetical protein